VYFRLQLFAEKYILGLLQTKLRQSGEVYFLSAFSRTMRLDGKMIQEAIKQLIAEFKYDPYQVLDIVKMGVKTAYKKDYMPNERKANIQVAI